MKEQVVDCALQVSQRHGQRILQGGLSVAAPLSQATERFHVAPRVPTELRQTIRPFPRSGDHAELTDGILIEEFVHELLEVLGGKGGRRRKLPAPVLFWIVLNGSRSALQITDRKTDEFLEQDNLGYHRC